MSLIEQLFGQPNTFVGSFIVQVGHPDISRNLNLQVIGTLSRCLGMKSGFAFAGFKKPAVKDRYVKVEADGCIAILYLRLTVRNDAGRAENPDIRVVKGVFGANEFIRRALLQVNALEFRPVRKRLPDQAVDLAGNGFGRRLLCEDEHRFTRYCQHCRKLRLCRLQRVFRLDQQEFGVLEIDVGKAYIQLRSSVCSGPMR